VVRSTWDYHKDPAAFLVWIDKVSAQNTLWNVPSLLRWSMNKRYLLDLAARGVRIVPTIACDAGSHPDLEEMFAKHEWDAAIIKPVIGLCTH
jgi:hypothetical protein